LDEGLDDDGHAACKHHFWRVGHKARLWHDHLITRVRLAVMAR
jgi:hypothetical protein